MNHLQFVKTPGVLIVIFSTPNVFISNDSLLSRMFKYVDFP
ncbi:hypothetical protein LEP1GSC151_0388 [Leptospira interrogans serovar Grippotyphosa str. LT2186]|uniref:Uncharacterized protein n=1 Tax=Leptospira interrogans serovar Grippotyphosa str. LT2186 TaxID=1001599 RepID=M3IDY8_LEPIR|nr:hypothetical protein LEP1GSC151_0388 [Leptospira interrogans serovar Grippotyphosa str. LT2186]